MNKLISIFKRNLLTTGMVVVVIGLVLVCIGVATRPDTKEVSFTSANTAKTDNKAKKSEPKVEGAATTEQPAETPAVQTPQTTNNNKNKPTSQPNTTTPTPASKPAPTTPKPGKPSFPTPPTVPTRITGVSVVVLNGCAGAYKYTVNFEGNTNATVAMSWEYVGAVPSSYPPSSALPTAYPIGGGGYSSTGYFFDTITADRGLAMFTGKSYSARIHVVGTNNDAYSNIVFVPESCQ